MPLERLDSDFFCKDVLDVAPSLIGKYLVLKSSEGIEVKFKITETEAYRGEEDLACHASKGKTARNAVMYEKGGLIYIYLIYGMYWMLNFVTGEKDNPQAVLIRGIEGYDGPGKLSRFLKLDKSFHSENLAKSTRIWVESDGKEYKYYTRPRIGIDYAGDKWKNIHWRFVIDNK